MGKRGETSWTANANHQQALALKCRQITGKSLWTAHSEIDGRSKRRKVKVRLAEAGGDLRKLY